jgi:hypothetical protein
MASELEYLEALLLKWPCSIRLRRRIAEERAALARRESARARELRGEIRRGLMAADEATLAQLAQLLGVA